MITANYKNIRQYPYSAIYLRSTASKRTSLLHPFYHKLAQILQKRLSNHRLFGHFWAFLLEIVRKLAECYSLFEKNLSIAKKDGFWAVKSQKIILEMIKKVKSGFWENAMPRFVQVAASL